MLLLCSSDTPSYRWHGHLDGQQALLASNPLWKLHCHTEERLGGTQDTELTASTRTFSYPLLPSLLAVWVITSFSSIIKPYTLESAEGGPQMCLPSLTTAAPCLKENTWSPSPNWKLRDTDKVTASWTHSDDAKFPRTSHINKPSQGEWQLHCCCPVPQGTPSVSLLFLALPQTGAL